VGLTGAFAHLNKMLSILANMTSNTGSFSLVDRNIHGTTWALINYMMKRNTIKPS
jgi:hypothetical protein